MTKKIIPNKIAMLIVLVSICKYNAMLGEKLGETWHFDTKILRDQTQTKQKLLEEGFQEVSFTNANNKKLGALFLERENARATIIFTHGFCPGGKEVFAPFVKIAPDYCNLLFLDMLGYGDSDKQNIFAKLKNYGKDNYKDIEAAIEHVNAHKSTKDIPIIVFGWCAGGFHSTTAVINLQNKVSDLHVKGLICDSGFGAVKEISDIPAQHVKENYVPSLFAKWYDGDKKKASKSLICKITKNIFAVFLTIVDFFLRPPVMKREPETNLYDKIHKLNTPALIIHNEDDALAKWENMEKLTKKMPEHKLNDLWLIEKGKSSHANNHLKVKEEYQEKMLKWTDRILKDNIPA